MIVNMTSAEVWQAAMIGVARRISAMRRQRGDRYGKPSRGYWDTDIFGALAELAVAKLTGRYWHALASDPRQLEGDVGRSQVRWTDRADGKLIVHPEDPDHARFYLVRGGPMQLDVVGSIYGAAAKDERFWFQGDGRPAFFVPAEALEPVGDDATWRDVG